MALGRTSLGNICLTLHCVSNDEMPIKTHRELFIKKRDLDALFSDLKGLGYNFSLPFQESDGPKCSVTFDDGYSNNLLFLELAEKYSMPFMLFVSSFYLQEQLPFAWDFWALSRQTTWQFNKADYKGVFTDEAFKQSQVDLMHDQAHRPLTIEELQYMATCKFTYFGLHTHSHQPSVGKFAGQLSEEIALNRQFFDAINLKYTDELALPCGLYTTATLRTALQLCERVYTTDGGNFDHSDRVIHRISLVNPDIGGPLLRQVVDGQSLKYRIKRKLSVLRYSHPFLL